MTAATATDRGLIGPLMKAYAHLFFLHFAKAYDFTVADTDAQAEAWAGVEHLEAIVAATPMITAEANRAKETTIATLRASVNTPNAATIETCLASLASFALVMDLELLGITDAAINPTGS